MIEGRRALIVLTALCVLAIKIVIAYNTYGTNDAITFEADIAKLKSSGPEKLYREGVEPASGHKQPFSHSPPVIHGLLLLDLLAGRSGLPVRFGLRVCCALADLATLFLLWKIGVRSTAALLLTALSPVSLMISGFHVNTDPLMVCAVLLSGLLILSQRFAWAGAALGVAISIKLTALVFVPALAIAAGAKKTALILGVSSLCFYGLSLPFSFEFPKTIETSMLIYAGLLRFWGISGLSLLTGADDFFSWYGRAGKFVALATVGMAAVIIRSRGRRGGTSQQLRTRGGALPGIHARVWDPIPCVPGALARRRTAVCCIGLLCGERNVHGSFLYMGQPWLSLVPGKLLQLNRSMPIEVPYLGLSVWIAVVPRRSEFVRTAVITRRSGKRCSLPRVQETRCHSQRLTLYGRSPRALCRGIGELTIPFHDSKAASGSEPMIAGLDVALNNLLAGRRGLIVR